MRPRPLHLVDPTQLAEAEQLALRLEAVSPRCVLAFVRHSGTTYFATEPRLDRSGRAPRSALVDLVQGVYARDPERALSILRNRIFLTAEPSEMDRGLLKVAARRMTSGLAARDRGLAALVATETLAPVAPSPAPAGAGLATALSMAGASVGVQDHAGFLAVAHKLADAVPRDRPRRFDRDRAIAALLVSREGEILSAAVNAITLNRTFHAEVCAIQSFHARTGRSLPPGTRLYSTLKPCRMCAGMAWHCAEDPHALEVYFSEDDPGPNARETVLDQARIGVLFGRTGEVGSPNATRSLKQIRGSYPDPHEQTSV